MEVILTHTIVMKARNTRYKWGYYPNSAEQRAKIKGFTTTAVSGMGCFGDLALDFPFMVYPGDNRSKRLQTFSGDPADSFLEPLTVKDSDYSASTVGEPGYFKATFAGDMVARVAAHKRSGMAEFTLPSSQTRATLFFTTASRMVRHDASLEYNYQR